MYTIVVVDSKHADNHIDALEPRNYICKNKKKNYFLSEGFAPNNFYHFGFIPIYCRLETTRNPVFVITAQSLAVHRGGKMLF